MFHDGSYMVGMHGFWWLFWLLMIGVWQVRRIGFFTSTKRSTALAKPGNCARRWDR